MFRMLTLRKLSRFKCIPSKLTEIITGVICSNISHGLQFARTPVHFANVNKSALFYGTNVAGTIDHIDTNLFEKVCEETLESLTEFFEDLMEKTNGLETADISLTDGVLTISLGDHGTYVINRQSPNKQVWLSSPISGPKRYDYVVDGSFWIYKHDHKALHQLLEEELSTILKVQIDLSSCLHSRSR